MAAQRSRGKNLLFLRLSASDAVPLKKSVSILYRNTDEAIRNINVK